MSPSRIVWRLIAAYGALVAAGVGLLGWIIVRQLGDTLPEGQLQEVQTTLWVGAAVLVVLTGCLSLWIAQKLRRPMLELTEAARRMARHEELRPVEVRWPQELRLLADSLRDMSQTAASTIAQMERDQQLLRAVFGSMAEGVVVVDADRQVLFLNEAAARALRIPLETASSQKLWQLVRHRQLSDALERVFDNEASHQTELEWNVPEHKVLALYGTRLPGMPVRGAVLVLHDVTDLRRLERLRQDFVANVSHELKTPLAAIQATVETLLDGAVHDPAHNLRFLQRISENSDRLNRLVQDLLSLGRIESGDEVLELQEVPLEGVIENCLARHEHRAQAKGIRLEAQPPPQGVIALADEEALAHILDNLVDNAIKYTPEGGSVTLRWSADGEQALLEVRDSGVGIPEKDLPRIFERFYRVDKARSRELGGTGLGLAIVKHLVQALSGTISVASEVGKGTAFTLRLPAVRQPEKISA